MRYVACWCVLLLSTICLSAQPCPRICVRDLVVPDYPVLAAMAMVQGRVTVNVGIGAHGEVISAKASGAHEILLRAAEKNVRQWSFWPPSGSGAFPAKHVIVFDYKLKGARVSNPACASVVFQLPDRVEVTAQPPTIGY